MRIAPLALAAAVGAAARTAFAPPSSPPRNPTALPVADAATLVDPSVFSDPNVLLGAAGAAGAAIVAAISGKSGEGETAAKAAPKKSGPDLSIPYDAAAILAYDAYTLRSSKKVDFAKFKALYEAQSVAEVSAKWQAGTVDEKRSAVEALRAELAAMEGELAGMEGSLTGSRNEAAERKSQIERLFGTTLEVAAAAVDAPDDDAAASSSGVELRSVDYDAAARLAYEAAGSGGDFDEFKTKYLADTSAMVAKKGLL